MKIYKSDGSTPQIYISGGWGYGNRGDNAILHSTLLALRETLPTATILLSSYSPKEIIDNHGLESVLSLHAVLYDRTWRGLWNRASLKLWELSRRRFPLSTAVKNVLGAYKASDVIILAGGGYFNDGWKDMRASQYATIRLAHHVGTPVVLCAQTLGHFGHASINGELQRHLAMVYTAALRDKPSLETARLAGMSSERSFLSADQANLLPPLLPPDGKRDVPVVGVMIQNFRPHYGEHGASPVGRVTKETYLPSIVRVLAKVADMSPVLYRLIPSTSWDEISIARLSTRLIDAGVEFEVVKNPTAQQYMHACQSVDMMISTNMHPIIIAASNFRPSIALSYNFKVDSFMDSIGLANQTTRIDDFEESDLVARISNVLGRLDELSSLVRERKTEVNALANKNMAAVGALFWQTE